MRAWSAAIGIAILSFLDIVAIRATVPTSGGRAPLPLDLSESGSVIGIYSVALTVVLVAWLLLGRRYLRGSRGASAIVLLFLALLVGRGVLATIGSRAPFDRARAARTVGKLRYVDERLQTFYQAHQRLPAALDEMGLSVSDLTDEWGQRFHFVPRADRMGYQVWSGGAPAGKPELGDYYPRLTKAVVLSPTRTAEGPTIIGTDRLPGIARDLGITWPVVVEFDVAADGTVSGCQVDSQTRLPAGAVEAICKVALESRYSQTKAGGHVRSRVQAPALRGDG